MPYRSAIRQFSHMPFRKSVNYQSLGGWILGIEYSKDIVENENNTTIVVTNKAAPYSVLLKGEIPSVAYTDLQAGQIQRNYARYIKETSRSKARNPLEKISYPGPLRYSTINHPLPTVSYGRFVTLISYLKRKELLQMKDLRLMINNQKTDGTLRRLFKLLLHDDIMKKKKNGVYQIDGIIKQKLDKKLEKNTLKAYLEAEAILEYSKVNVELWEKFDKKEIDFDTLLKDSQKIYEKIFSDLTVG